MRVHCNSVVWCSLRTPECSLIACAPLTAVQYGVLLLFWAHSSPVRTYPLIKPNVITGVLQEAKERNQCAYLHDSVLGHLYDE